MAGAWTRPNKNLILKNFALGIYRLVDGKIGIWDLGVGIWDYFGGFFSV